MNSTKVINLNENLYLSRGMHKWVYFHPDNPSLCIKIPYTANDIDLKRELTYRKILSQRSFTSELS